MLRSDLNPLDEGSPAGQIINFCPNAAQHRRTFGDSIACLDLIQRTLNDLALIAAQNAVKRAAHTDVADIAAAAHQLFIGRLHMRVRADNHNAPISEYLGEGFLLPGRFRMEIHEPQIRSMTVKNFTHTFKRTYTFFRKWNI